MNGPEALRQLDRSISDLRRSFREAVEDAERSDAREAEIRSIQMAGYRSLAEIRLDLLRNTADPGVLDKLHKSALDLMDQHAAYIDKQATALEEAAGRIEALEVRRAEQAGEHEAALEAYEIRVAEVEAGLAKDGDYQALAATSENAASVAARAHQKLNLARNDLEAKGKPYTDDPLFSYLWKRGYRTPAYRAGPVTRFLDHWVARLCKYDAAYLNYARLSDLPVWLEEHAATQDRLAAEALAALESYEETALGKAGADDLRQTADDLLAAMESLDREIESAEKSHGALATKHEQALRAQAGPAIEARRLLEDGLKQASFPDLRILAAETLDLDDDRIVDQLVKLRAEEMSLSLDSGRLAKLPGLLRRDLEDMEALRRRFKAARFDSPYASFKRTALNDILSGLAMRRLTTDRAFSRIQRALRRVEPRAEPGFGGRQRSSALGLPDVLGDVIWEIAREAGRGSSIGFPSGGRGKRRSRRRSPRISIPAPRRRNGFKTGGGF